MASHAVCKAWSQLDTNTVFVKELLDLLTYLLTYSYATTLCEDPICYHNFPPIFFLALAKKPYA